MRSSMLTTGHKPCCGRFASGSSGWTDRDGADWVDRPIQANDSRGDTCRSAHDRQQRSRAMDLVAYWQQHCAPFIPARYRRSERGESLVDYALLVALIAVVCIVAIPVVRKKASRRGSSTASSLI